MRLLAMLSMWAKASVHMELSNLRIEQQHLEIDNLHALASDLSSVEHHTGDIVDMPS